VLLPLPAAMLEIMAGAEQESKQGVPEPCPEGRAAGRKQGSAAGARGRGTRKPERGLTYEVNRRAEGTSELNRRLGGGAGCCFLRLLRCWRLWPGLSRKASAVRWVMVGRPGSSKTATGQRRRIAKAWNAEAKARPKLYAQGPVE